MIDIANLSEEDIALLKKHFLENRVIQFKDILQPIEEFFWKFDLNSETQSYELYMGVPKDWIHDMILNGYKIELVNETDNGKIIKLLIDSTEYVADVDELILFAIDIIQRNNAILAKIREKEKELKLMKEKMIEVQLALDKEIENLKTINVNDPPAVEESEDEITEEEKIPVSKEDAEKFIELVSNGKK
jgi:hypothetical protein